jgi:hypothetical protein
MGKEMTNTIIRITTKHGSASFGPCADGTQIVGIKCIRSEFGRPGVIYALRLAANAKVPDGAFDIRNGKDDRYLGVWEVMTGESGNATLWDSTDAPAAKQQSGKTSKTPQNTAQPATAAVQHIPASSNAELSVLGGLLIVPAGRNRNSRTILRTGV